MRAQMQLCIDNNINRLFLPNVDIASIDKIMNMVRIYPEHCFPMLGLHPCSVTESFKEDLATLEQKIKENEIVAIGESGLEVYWDTSTLEFQKEHFRIQVSWAKNNKLPIVNNYRIALND